MMLNIAFDDTIFSIQKYGGISRYFSVLAHEYVNQGNVLRIHAGVYSNAYIKHLPSNLINGYNLSTRSVAASSIFRFTNHFYSEASLYYSQPDIIHETYYKSLPCRKKGALRVCTAHDLIHELYPDNFSNAARTTKRKRETFKRVDHIISISENTKRDLMEVFGIPESKISVVHHGVDACYFRKPRPQVTVSERDYILYVGARSGYKNFKRFVQTCAQSSIIKNKIKIVAFGGGGFSSDEVRFFSDLGFSEQFVKHVEGSDEVLSTYYSNALVFVCPSVYEGFGLTVLEAMASGCPVITSNTSSLPEVVNDAGILVDPTSLDEMQLALEDLILSSSMRAELVELGYQNVKNFSWGACASNTLKVYKDIL